MWIVNVSDNSQCMPKRSLCAAVGLAYSAFGIVFGTRDTNVWHARAFRAWNCYGWNRLFRSVYTYFTLKLSRHNPLKAIAVNFFPKTRITCASPSAYTHTWKTQHFSVANFSTKPLWSPRVHGKLMYSAFLVRFRCSIIPKCIDSDMCFRWFHIWIFYARGLHAPCCIKIIMIVRHWWHCFGAVHFHFHLLCIWLIWRL